MLPIYLRLFTFNLVTVNDRIKKSEVYFESHAFFLLLSQPNSARQQYQKQVASPPSLATQAIFYQDPTQVYASFGFLSPRAQPPREFHSS